MLKNDNNNKKILNWFQNFVDEKFENFKEKNVLCIKEYQDFDQ